MIDLEQKSPIEQSLIRWLYDFATFGILVTDTDLRIVYANSWFTKHLGADASAFLGSPLIDAFPDMRARAFERFYQDALSGQTRVLSQRFHGYLFKMRPATGSGPAQMQQSARISPLLLGSTVVGTISFIEDVSERVRHENELHFQIDERSRLLESEISARELAEENERLRDASEMLRIEGAQLLELGRDRDMLMHRIIAGQEEERKRIARNIHDHLGQQLTALRYSLSLIKPQMTEGTPLCESVRRAQAIAENLDREVDYLSWELRPAEIDDIGLEEALKTLIREWTAHYGIEVKFHSV
ncbi:MAG TPA: PAS domain-containing protein, partial [Pyrinomonadaceae bacterium]|nr:PAS domain-containing protein [Pyrinomonadaceae bacterium]